jgi:hypothetical protein
VYASERKEYLDVCIINAFKRAFRSRTDSQIGFIRSAAKVA